MTSVERGSQPALLLMVPVYLHERAFATPGVAPCARARSLSRNPVPASLCPALTGLSSLKRTEGSSCRAGALTSPPDRAPDTRHHFTSSETLIRILCRSGRFFRRQRLVLVRHHQRWWPWGMWGGWHRGPRLGAGPVGGSVGSRLPAAEASPWGPWPSHPQVKHLLRPAWHIRGPPWGDVSPGTSGRHTEQQPLRSAVCPVHREGNRGSCLWKAVPAGCGRTSSGRTSQSPEPPARRPPPLPGGPCLGDSQKPQLSGISRPGPGSAPLPRSPLRVPPPEPGLCREPHWPAEGSGNELVSGQPRVTVREGKSPPLPGPRSPPGRLFFTWWPPRSPLLQALA